MAQPTPYLRFDLPFEIVSLATVFETMEVHKQSLGILDYSASQPTLESIFLAIAEKDIVRRDGHPARPTRPGSKMVAAAPQATRRAPPGKANPLPHSHGGMTPVPLNTVVGQPGDGAQV